jgi:tRNA threonylcarbamoyladenosine biosynthesis protein TsaE
LRREEPEKESINPKKPTSTAGKTVAKVTAAKPESRPGPSSATIVDFVTHSATQTQKAGAVLGRLLQPGDIILLEGDLGVGKTTFTKGIGQGLLVEGYVNSPTFTLVNEYQGRLPLYHLDCYRLESGREALDFGLEEYLYGEGAIIIEWPERIAEVLPSEVLRVKLGYVNDTKRAIRLEPLGARYVALTTEFKKTAFGA